ncbi:MAG: hypothetical protein DHS20C21_04290 [Gemmatimonadota bacterium]|nr:MAG: hypothetical protein DHS20C21_04290 [Gemmatimonadota bacterium]
MSDECRHEDCKKVNDLLSEFLDEELKGAVLLELKEHIEKCPDCHLNVDSVRKVIRLYRDATECDCPVDIQIRLKDVIRRAREEETGR